LLRSFAASSASVHVIGIGPVSGAPVSPLLLAPVSEPPSFPPSEPLSAPGMTAGVVSSSPQPAVSSERRDAATTSPDAAKTAAFRMATTLGQLAAEGKTVLRVFVR